jgi:hypothetical protein
MVHTGAISIVGCCNIEAPIANLLAARNQLCGVANGSVCPPPWPSAQRIQ